MISETIRSAAAYFDIALEDLTGARRTNDVVRVRHAVIYVLRHRYNMSLPQIGRRMNRDHSSIMHALRVFDARFAGDSEVMQWVGARLNAPKRWDEPPAEVKNLVRLAAEAEAKLAERPKPPAPKKDKAKEARHACSRKTKVPRSTWETIKLAGCQFQVNENGETRGELLQTYAIKSATRSLLLAIRAHHPERFAG
jgi:hypothetical protein